MFDCFFFYFCSCLMLIWCNKDIIRYRDIHVVRSFLNIKYWRLRRWQRWFSPKLGFHLKILVFMCDFLCVMITLFFLHMFTVFWTSDKWVMQWFKSWIKCIINSLDIREFCKGYPRIYASWIQESSVWVFKKEISKYYCLH